MAEVIRMPKMSDTMTEGVLAAWLKKEGEEVRSGDILAEVETDKATMELENYEDGVLLHLGVKEKETVPVDGVIAVIGEKGENIASLLAELSAPTADTTAAPQASSQEETPQATPMDTSNIAAQVIKMPKMSDTMTEGVIAAWLKKVGDEVKSGDLLAEVETDKATMELENYEDGVLLYTAVEAGKSVPVDGVIAVIGEKDADYKALLKAEAHPAAPAPQTSAKASPKKAPNLPAAPHPTPAPLRNGRILASPLAKRLAEEKGFDITQIAGSGESGRIVKRDVETFVPAIAPGPPTGSLSAAMGVESYEDLPATQMRKAIAKSVTQSQFGAPHFYLTMEIDMEKTIEARKSLNEGAQVKISFNDIVIKAVASALKKHPEVNTYWMSDTQSIRMNHHVNIGVAMATPEGLVVPVVRFADQKPLATISAEIKTMGGRVKDKKIKPEDMQGNTFTVSNLGMFGIEAFTSILHAPASCILAVGAIVQKPVVKEDEIAIGHRMKITLTCDHRTVDGAVGSAFLQTLKGMLEHPIKML